MTKHPLAKRMPLFLVVGAVLLITAFVYFVQQLTPKDEGQKKKMVQQITVITPPPPPPPPPPKEEPPPEPEVQEPLEQPEPEPTPDEPVDEAPAQDLGVDAEGGAGGDGFGLVGRKGGRSLLAGKGGSGYGYLLQETITEKISEDSELKYMDYSMLVKVWVSQDKKLERYEVKQVSGDPEAKKKLDNILARLGYLDKAPPLEMPQPIRLRINSRI